MVFFLVVFLACLGPFLDPRLVSSCLSQKISIPSELAKRKTEKVEIPGASGRKRFYELLNVLALLFSD
jgi:hypothetical protein